VIYLPNDYAAIILSGIVTSPDEAPITTKILVGFEVHLPYLTKDSNATSLLVAAGPNVAVNLILSLPFIKAMGIIADFIDNVCLAKHLLCNPFPIDFCSATKSIPVIKGCNSACTHSAAFNEVHQALGLLNVYFACKVDVWPLHIIAPQGMVQWPLTKSPNKVSFGLDSFGNHWVPPKMSATNTNDYLHLVLGDLGYM
jgi:hypothetical protein